MPDPSGGAITRWQRVGRLLPREVRERIYEPALTDAWYRWHESGQELQRVPFALHAVGTVIGCVPPAMSSLFIRRGVLTWTGRICLGAAILFLTVVVVAQLIAARTPGY